MRIKDMSLMDRVNYHSTLLAVSELRKSEEYQNRIYRINNDDGLIVTQFRGSSVKPVEEKSDDFYFGEVIGGALIVCVLIFLPAILTAF